jgi:hypothetical protein
MGVNITKQQIQSTGNLFLVIRVFFHAFGVPRMQGTLIIPVFYAETFDSERCLRQTHIIFETTEK